MTFSVKSPHASMQPLTCRRAVPAQTKGCLQTTSFFDVKYPPRVSLQLVFLIAVAAASVVGPAAAANASATHRVPPISDSSSLSPLLENASRFRLSLQLRKPFDTSSMTPSRPSFRSRQFESRPQLQGNLHGIVDQRHTVLLKGSTVNLRASSTAILTGKASARGANSNGNGAIAGPAASDVAPRDASMAAAPPRQALGRRAETPPLALRRDTLIPSVAEMAFGHGSQLRGSRVTPMYGTDDTTVSDGSADGDVGDIAAVSAMTWKVCGGGPPGAHMLSPHSVTLSPDPPHHGRTLAVNVSGTNPISTSGGRLRVAVLYMGFKVYTYESALCDAMACPLVEGSAFELQVSQKLPALAPPGAYQMEITGEDQGGARFMCVRISFQVALPTWPGLRRDAGVNDSSDLQDV
ncbi:hypothetical protein Vretimale_9388 [Volvox reticuliferus]|uniref:MD-2-related lipid-recognition domain-containing protein n=1 Tax=Volvox reticuliferus TaxID=1737510 RepID=A0A8J4FPR8_9CHLO|nr:hypothetical protein Vretifemale_9890 [Volvox reticuliferus]GIM04894.1 hypothetical protein Vretimale_9388 [Volvox reticuliferus]